MDELQNIRWRKRFENLNRAFLQLERGIRIVTPSDIETQGIIQSFEFTFELAWKTLKDYLEAQGVQCAFPREVLKQAFQAGVLQNGDVWLEMLSKRNLLAHTYGEAMAKEAYRLIKEEYYPCMLELIDWFRGQAEQREDD